jgi:hypothetical protein
MPAIKYPVKHGTVDGNAAIQLDAPRKMISEAGVVVVQDNEGHFATYLCENTFVWDDPPGILNCVHVPVILLMLHK